MPFKPHPTDPNKMVYEKPQYNLMWGKRPWVGLTEQDLSTIVENAPSKEWAVLMTEATLKEKNT